MQPRSPTPGLGPFLANSVVLQVEVYNGAVDLQSRSQRLAKATAI